MSTVKMSVVVVFNSFLVCGFFVWFFKVFSAPLVLGEATQLELLGIKSVKVPTAKNPGVSMVLAF